MTIIQGVLVALLCFLTAGVGIGVGVSAAIWTIRVLTGTRREDG